MKLATGIDRFARQQAADGRSGHTRAAYRRDLEALGRWLGNDPDVRRIAPDALARFLVSDQVLLTPSGSPRKPITVNRTKSALRSFFGFCVDSGWIKDNPARLIRSARTTAREPATLTQTEIERLRTALSDRTERFTPASWPARRRGGLAQRDRLILELLLGTGIRLGSLVGLNVGDVDLRAGTLHIRAKGGAQERVFLNPMLVRSWACSSEKSPHRATVALRRPYSAAGGAHGWDRGRFNCGSPPCAARPASPAVSRSTPSATPSPPACTTRPAICTWSSAPSATGTSRRRRSMLG